VAETQFSKENIDKSETNIRQLAEHLRIILWLFSADLKQAIYISPSYSEITGYPLESIYNHPESWLDHIFHEDRPRIVEAIESWKLGEQSETEFRLVRPDGTIRWMRNQAFPICNELGEVFRIGGVSEDITEHKEEELQLQIFSQIIRQMKDAVILVNQEGKIVYVNPAFGEIYGYSPDEIIGKPSRSLFAGDEEEFHALVKDYQEQIAQKGLYRGEFRDRRKDGSILWVSTTACHIRMGDGQEYFTLNINRDITGRKQSEASMQQANEKLRLWVRELEQRNEEVSLLNEMGDLLQTCLVSSEAITIVAQYLGKLFAEQSGALYLIGQPGNLLEPVVSWGDQAPQESFFAPLQCWSLRRGRVHRFSAGESGLLCPHLEQDTRIHTDHLSTLCVPMSANNRTLGLLHLRLSAEQPLAHWQQLAVNVAERVALALVNLELTETLRQQSTHDPLTGLFNRRYIEEMLEREMRRADQNGSELGLALVDIDHFDQFNIVLGYQTGDLLLQKFGKLLQSRFSGAVPGTSGRYESDQFIILLPQFRADQVYPLLQSVGREFKDLMTIPDRSQRTLAISIGLAVYPQDGATVEVLIRSAEEALHKAKAQGGDQLVMKGEE